MSLSSMFAGILAINDYLQILRRRPEWAWDRTVWAVVVHSVWMRPFCRFYSPPFEGAVLGFSIV